MSYPGKASLEPRFQQRVLTAFKEAVRLYQDGLPEEARTILRSIADVDDEFQPAQRLEEAIESGAQVDLSMLLGMVSATSSVDVPALLARGREALRRRMFLSGLEATNELLKELPCHAEARRLLADIQNAQRVALEAEGYLGQASAALDEGRTEEARTLLRLAGNKDPEHPDIAELLVRLGSLEIQSEGEGEFEFEVCHDDPPAQEAPAEELSQAVESWGAWEDPAAVTPPEDATPEPPAPSDGSFQVAASGDFPVAEPGGFELAAAEDLFTVPGGEEHAGQPVQAPSGPEGPKAAGGGDWGSAAWSPEPAAGDELFTDDGPDRVRGLLEQGQEAFDRGDFQAAIDRWSRIFLIDAHHQEAESRVEAARRRLEETERQAEHLFYEARDAFEQGGEEEARRLCHQVLEIQPQHVEARDLLARLDTPLAPPPAPTAPDVDEDDLFKDEFVPAAMPAEAAAGGAGRPKRGAQLPSGPSQALGSRVGRRHVPTPLLAVVGGILVLLLVVGFVLRGNVFSGGGAVEQALAEAERLAAVGQLQDAINMLEAVEANDEQFAVINQRRLEYVRQLRAQPTPVAPPDLTAMREAWVAGRRLQTVRLVREALSRSPGNPELLEFQDEVLAFSGQLPGLADAVEAGNLETAARISEQILSARPDDREIRGIWVNANYNRALLLLRRYQVVAAFTILERVVARHGDEEVRRLMDFAGAYRTRPRDPRFDLFVTNLEFRPLS